MRKLNALYFSATSTTRKCVTIVASAINLPLASSINIADRNHIPLPDYSKDEAVIVAVPVYGGRIPSLAVDKLTQVKGNGAKAIAMVVYGNRDYDDALLELTDILKAQDFHIIAAAAFIGQHSIFPKVGTSRPDNSDMKKLSYFGKICSQLLDMEIPGSLKIKGNRPYKKYGGVPVHPEGSREKCITCGTCVELCPVAAINSEEPWKTNADTCISCGRCISVCRQGARNYKGIKYNLIGTVFTAAFSKRKEPDIIYPSKI
ncbi:MAG: 4Fe-4S binding protein [Muribaculaceae bacterium]|nr:4Fe-4S binding protein [Muribaculaceae bacterium]